jgi:iron complex outermembrane recepter protein
VEWVLLLHYKETTHSIPRLPITKAMKFNQCCPPHHSLTVGALLCLSVFPSAEVHAQSSTSDLNEIVVQSGRLEQKQFDAPASVYNIDAETLRNSGPQVNISDVLNRAPGVVALNRNNYAQDVQISIRGFGARSAFGVRGIRLIADGIPASMPDGQGQTSTISMTSTDRMEVLTGPLAQLYGNASGGVIQTFTREAGETPEAQVNLHAGSYGMTRTDWQISQRTGNVGLVADYSTFNIDGYRQNSSTERKQLNSVITVDAKPDTRFKFILNVFDMPYAMDALGLKADQLSTPSIAGNGALLGNTRKTIKHEQAGAVMEHTINSDLKFQGRIYGGNRTNLQYQASSANPPTASGTWIGLDRQFEGLGLQLTGKAKVFGDQKINWIIGADFDHAQEQRQSGATASGEKTGALTRNELNEVRNQDYFAQANWSLGERYTLTTGVRQSNVTLKSRDDMPTGVDGSGSVDYSATSPILGFTWHALDNLNLYLNQGKGFETPTMSEVAYSGTNAGSFAEKFNPTLLASRSKHLEVGTKWVPTSSSRIDAAFFQINTENEIVSAYSNAGKTAYANAAQTKRDGFEIAMRHQHNPHWRSQVSATFINATYESGTASFSDKNGNNLPAIPKRQLFTSLQWSEKGFAQAGQAPALGLEVNLDLINRSSMWANDANSSTAADYALAPGFSQLNARVRQRYQIGAVRIEAFVGVDNLTNKDTISSVIVNQSKQQYFEPGLPRSWVVGLTSKIPL